MRSRILAALSAAGALTLAACAAGGTAGTPTMVASVVGRPPGTSVVAAKPSVAPSLSMAVSTVTVTSTVGGTPTADPPRSTVSTIPSTDLSGDVYGFITAVDPARSELTLDKIDWFTGDAARQACAQDGVTGTDNNRCTGWYFRNNNPALRVVVVAPDATISTLGGDLRPEPGDLTAVAAAVGAQSPWRLTVTDGQVRDLEQLYLP